MPPFFFFLVYICSCHSITPQPSCSKLFNMPPRVPWPSRAISPFSLQFIEHEAPDKNTPPFLKLQGPLLTFLLTYFPCLYRHTSLPSSGFPLNSSIPSSATPLKYLRGSVPSPSWARQLSRPTIDWLHLVCSAVGLSAFCTGLQAPARPVSFAQCCIWSTLNKAWQKVGVQYILTEWVFTFAHQKLVPLAQSKFHCLGVPKSSACCIKNIHWDREKLVWFSIPLVLGNLISAGHWRVLHFSQLSQLTSCHLLPVSVGPILSLILTQGIPSQGPVREWLLGGAVQ